MYDITNGLLDVVVGRYHDAVWGKHNQTKQDIYIYIHIHLDALQPLQWIDFGGISHFDHHVIYQNVTRLIECIVVPFHLIYFVFM